MRWLLSSTSLSDMAEMSDRAQGQYIAWWLDFVDEREGGGHRDEFDWIVGRASTRSLDRMRAVSGAL